MLITRLHPAHAAPYRALMLEAYALHPEAFTSSVNERSDLPHSWWAARLSEEPSAAEAVFGAFVGDELAGAAGISFDTREKAGHKSTLFGMYVPDRFGKKGVGRQLVGELLRHARSRPQARIIQLTVTEGNTRAQALYEASGFLPFGTEPFAVRVGAEYVAKVHMWRHLHPSTGKNADPPEG
ncbi:MAG: GNAT family N-acetyltransferase [Polaromonas sp.]|nr:GNAT family N-acetyltransferase [Polaromonas sp.]